MPETFLNFVFKEAGIIPLAVCRLGVCDEHTLVLVTADWMGEFSSDENK